MSLRFLIILKGILHCLRFVLVLAVAYPFTSFFSTHVNVILRTQFAMIT